MKTSLNRRHNHWLEKILLSNIFLIFIGWLLSVILPYVMTWHWSALLNPRKYQLVTIIFTGMAYLLTHLSILQVQKFFPGGRGAGFIAAKVLLVYGIVALLAFMRYIEISHYFVIISALITLMWMYSLFIITYKHRYLKLAVIPNGQYTKEILALDFLRTTALKKLDLGGIRYDGVVADFEHCDIPTQCFLTQCALNRTAVYDAKNIYESLTGRVKIHRMTENNLGSLLPSPGYELIKRCIDLCIIFIFAPVALLISLITALLIRLESNGSIIYSQQRIGQRGRSFIIYKFRSMHSDRKAPQQFAAKDDPRITRVGKIIRKLRIDELPQFINVLRGEMSLIGPRPEQPKFVAEYEEKIPFYNYRHIVKPGITGWAQVLHGYAANTDEARVKIEHDFYYIKNCSFSLDLIIILMTLKVMFNGFGAK